MSTGEIFQIALGLLTALTLLYNYRAGNKAKQRELEANERKTALETKVSDRKSNFEELQTSLQAARDDNAYLKKEAADARTEKAETERQYRDRLREQRAEYMEQLRSEREGCARAVTTFSTRLERQMAPILPPDLRTRLRTTLRSLHDDLYQVHLSAQEFDGQDDVDDPDATMSNA